MDDNGYVHFGVAYCGYSIGWWDRLCPSVNWEGFLLAIRCFDSWSLQFWNEYIFLKLIAIFSGQCLDSGSSTVEAFNTVHVSIFRHPPRMETPVNCGQSQNNHTQTCRILRHFQLWTYVSNMFYDETNTWTTESTIWHPQSARGSNSHFKHFFADLESDFFPLRKYQYGFQQLPPAAAAMVCFLEAITLVTKKRFTWKIEDNVFELIIRFLNFGGHSIFGQYSRPFISTCSAVGFWIHQPIVPFDKLR